MSSSHGHYYVPDGSRWPIIAVLGMFSTLLGTAFWINGLGLGPWLTALGLVGILYYFLAGSVKLSTKVCRVSTTLKLIRHFAKV